MSSKLAKQPQYDPQQIILGFLAVKYLQENGGQTILMSMDEMKQLGQFTVRMEIVDPLHPDTSAIKCSCITVADAIKMVQEMDKMKGMN